VDRVDTQRAAAATTADGARDGETALAAVGVAEKAVGDASGGVITASIVSHSSRYAAVALGKGREK
jgi:hypothetical protein